MGSTGRGGVSGTRGRVGRRLGGAVRRIGTDRGQTVLGGVVAVAVAALIFTRFGMHGTLSRDEAIYTYGGQRLAHGLAPYASIFDPKTPLPTMIAGLAAVLARLTGRDTVAVIRLTFFAMSCLAVLFTFLLGTRLWRSRLAGLTTAVVFASFRGLALDALSGPDAKTPGILFVVVSTWFLARRQWFWAALTGSLGFLVWQPLILYPVLVLVVALLATPTGRRRRALGAVVAGGLIPVFLTGVYLTAAGVLGRFWETCVVFPLTGIVRTDETVPGRIAHIAGNVTKYYGFSGVLFWAGSVSLVALAVTHLLRRRRDLRRAVRAPLVSVVATTFAGQVLYACTDYQSYPDLYPLLVYAALGLGGLVALARGRFDGARSRRWVEGIVLLALTALVVTSCVAFTRDPRNNDALTDQRTDACAINQILPRGSRLWSLGDPTMLVLTHRRNPDRFIFLSSGVARWKVEHTPGGFAGWTAQIQRVDPSVVVVEGWPEEMSLEMEAWLRDHGYTRYFVGPWRTFVDDRAFDRARKYDVALSRSYPTPVVLSPGGRPLRTPECR